MVLKGFMAASGEENPNLFERAEIDVQFHAGFAGETVFHGLGIHDFADGNTGGKNAAESAGDHILAGLQIRAAGKITEADE